MDGAIAPDAKPRLSGELKGELWMLTVAVVVTGLSVLLQPSDDAVSLFGWSVPPLCLFQNLFGLECWGCGLTRSFTYMGHLEPAMALDRHRMGPVFFLLVVAQIPLRSWRAWRITRGHGLGDNGG